MRRSGETLRRSQPSISNRRLRGSYCGILPFYCISCCSLLTWAIQSLILIFFLLGNSPKKWIESGDFSISWWVYQGGPYPVRRPLEMSCPPTRKYNPPPLGLTAGAALCILLRLHLQPQCGILQPQSVVCTPNVFTVHG